MKIDFKICAFLRLKNRNLNDYLNIKIISKSRWLNSDGLKGSFLSYFLLRAFFEYPLDLFRDIFDLNTHFDELFVEAVENINTAQGLEQHAYDHRGN